MMTINQLYERALNQGIEIDNVKMRELRAISFPEGWIAIDMRKFDSKRELKCILAHEIGHCETGSFYNIYSPFDLKAKCEYKANKRAVEILMPIDEVREAMHNGYRSAWALAELFEVTQTFAHMAMTFYAEKLHDVKHVVKRLEMPRLMRASELPRPMPKAAGHDVIDYPDDDYESPF